jgi:phenylacetate-CoA ligase
VSLRERAGFVAHLGLQLASSARYAAHPDEVRRKKHEARLFEIVRYARRTSLYYASAFADPPVDDLSGFERLARLTKATLVGRFDDLVTDPAVTVAALTDYFRQPFDFRRRFRDKYLAFHTSGSTGQPAYLVWGPREFGRSTGAFLFHLRRALRLAGTPWRRPRFAYIGILDDYVGGNSWAYAARGAARVAMLSAFQDVDALCKQLRAFRPDVLMTKPTILGALARRQGAGALDLRLRAVVFAGENIAPQDREDIERHFGVVPINSYSMCETGPIGVEGRPGDGCLDVYDDVVHVELLDDDGQPVREFYRSGQVVVTSLLNLVMPIIRYETGDRAQYVPRAEGLDGRALSYVEGRSTRYFFLRAATDRIVPVPEYPFWSLHVPGVLRYQVHQQSPEHLVVRVQWAGEGGDRVEAVRAMREKIDRIVSDTGRGALRLDFEDAVEISPNRAGKIQITHPLAPPAAHASRT